MKGGEGALVVVGIVLAEIGELPRDRERAPSPPMMEIDDFYLNIGKMLSHRARQVGEPDGLEPHVGVVEVLDRRLDQ
jgi:hypothetical protein